MERNQFTFYRSFYEAIRRIRKDGDRAKAYDAICAYALYGTEPDMDKLPDAAAIAFDLIKPNLDASKRKAENGKRGGSEKQTGSKQEANGKHLESKQEANGKRVEVVSEKEKEKEKEIEIENKCYSPTPLRGNAPTLEQVTEFAKIRKSPVDPKAFFDYFSAAGWRDSEGKPVYNWKQKFIAWELRENQRPAKQSAKPGGDAPARPKAAPGENMARMREYLKQAKEGQG